LLRWLRDSSRVRWPPPPPDSDNNADQCECTDVIMEGRYWI
jgi:hypothetical protein